MSALTLIYRPIRKFITGESYVAQWQTLVADADKKTKEHEKLLEGLFEDGDASRTKAQGEFLARPSEKTLAACIEAEARREAKQKVSLDLREQISTIKSEAINARADLLLLALQEVEGALRKAHDEVIAADAARAEETGVVDPSARLLSDLNRRVDQCREGQGYAKSPGWINSARGTLASVAGVQGV